MKRNFSTGTEIVYCFAQKVYHFDTKCIVLTQKQNLKFSATSLLNLLDTSTKASDSTYQTCCNIHQVRGEGVVVYYVELVA